MLKTENDVIAEYQGWLAEQPDTPAKRWCLANPPRTRDDLKLGDRVMHYNFKLALALSA